VIPGKLSKRVVSDRLSWVDRMLNEIRRLPLGDREAFFSDRRNIWTAESCLRRALEALLDLGRHILAKVFGVGVSEYKEIALRLEELNVLSSEDAQLLRTFAGYRNRLVHFYHEVTEDELYEICASHLGDIERVRDAYISWIKMNQELLDQRL